MKEFNRIAAYIDLDAVEYNFESMKANLKDGTKMAAVIKADGYGHGAVEIAQVVEDKEYIWGFAVATAGEALELRSAGISKPVLVLGYVFPDAYPALIENEVRFAVFRTDMAEEISREAVRQGRDAFIHIKVDTGMGRIGFKDDDEGAAAVKEISGYEGLVLEGLFTHFARADETDKKWAHRQLSRYLEFDRRLKDAGVDVSIRHASNSAGIIDLPEANLDMVRAGISIYGLYPSEEVDKGAVPLKPVMSLKSHIVHVKDVEPGTQISYGGTYEAESPAKVATVPVGYADGYPRGLSNKGYVLIRGQKAPIRGRVCMDQFMVDVTDIEGAADGDEVILTGRDASGASISVEELGDLAGRFNYEFVCDVCQRVPRIYIRNGKVSKIKEGTR